jgi:hypothetical protein
MWEKKQSTEAAVRDIRRRTRRKLSPEEEIRIVFEGLRGEAHLFRAQIGGEENGGAGHVLRGGRRREGSPSFGG